MASDQQFCLRWNNHQNTLVSIFDSLLESGSLVDCTLAADGKFLQAHKVVLSACSPYLAMLLREHHDKFPILILKDIKFQELQAMMNYMYRGEVNITQETLGSFLKAAESLQIRGLTDNSSGGESLSAASSEISSPNELSSSSVATGAGTAAVASSLPSLAVHNNNYKNMMSEGRKSVSALPSSTQQQAQLLSHQQRERSPVLPHPQSKKYSKSSDIIDTAAGAAFPPSNSNNCRNLISNSSISNSNNVCNNNSTGSGSTSHNTTNNSSCNNLVAAASNAAVNLRTCAGADSTSSVILAANDKIVSNVKRRKLLPPIKSEGGLVVTPVNPISSAAAAVFSSSPDENNSCGDVPSQTQSLPTALEGRASVPSPLLPAKLESRHAQSENLIAGRKISPNAAGVTPESAETKMKSLADLSNIKNEQLDECSNDNTNEDCYIGEDNSTDTDRDENMPMFGGLPFHNSSNLENSLGSQDGLNNSIQDNPECQPSKESQPEENARIKTLRKRSSTKVVNATTESEVENAVPISGLKENIVVSVEPEEAVLPRLRKSKVSYASSASVDLDSCGNKRRFATHQVNILKEVFEQSPYITQSQAATIARETGLKKLQVRKWFSDYRCKMKRQLGSLEKNSSSPPHKDNSSAAEFEEEQHIHKRTRSLRMPKKRATSLSFEPDPATHSEEDYYEVVMEPLTSTRSSSKAVATGPKNGVGKRSKKKGKKRSSDAVAEYVPKRGKQRVEEASKVKRFNPFQVTMLKNAYSESPYINQRQAAMLARNIGLKKMQVRKWFCDYRCKMRKQSQPQDEYDDLSSSKRNAKRNSKMASETYEFTDEEDGNVEEEDEDEVVADAAGDGDFDVIGNGVSNEDSIIPTSAADKSRNSKKNARFTDDQLKILKREFEKSQFLTEEKLNELSFSLDEPKERIQTWFKTKRFKLRQSEQKFWTDIIDKSS